MIKIEIIDNQIKGEILSDFTLDEGRYPLKFRVWEEISNNLVWETDLYPGTWASFPNKTDIKITIETSDGVVLEEREYHHSFHDCPLYRFWDYFCKTNRDSIGVIFGAGDGTWGEWVLPIHREKTRCHLVEANKEDFEKLKATYGERLLYKLHDDLISAEGGRCEFHIMENASGVHTIDLDYSKKWVGEFKYKTIQMESVSVLDFLKKIGQVDYIRIDLEGIDYDIIKKIPVDYVKNLKFIQFEHWGLPANKIQELNIFFSTLGFKKFIHKIDTIYYREI